MVDTGPSCRFYSTVYLPLYLKILRNVCPRTTRKEETGRAFGTRWTSPTLLPPGREGVISFVCFKSSS